MKRVVCPKCGNIFDVNEKKDLVQGNCCHCKECNEVFFIENGMKKLQQDLKYFNGAGYKDLYQRQNYERAFDEYEHCLKLRDNDLGAIAGMAISKIYGSTIDELKFLYIIELLESHEIVLDPENTFIYLSFVRDAIYSFDYFLNVTSLKIQVDGVFLAKEYFDYYLNGVKDIKKVMEYLISSLPLCDETEYKTFLDENKKFNEYVEIMQNGLKNRLNKQYDIKDLGLVTIKDGEIVETTKKDYDIVEPKAIEFTFLAGQEKAKKIRNGMIIYYSILTVAIIGLLIGYFVTKITVLAILEVIPVLLAVAGYFLFNFIFKKSY